ncbi:MAG: hypothetical protein ACKVQA_11975 [Burkholderiales bacterium]
MDPNWFYSTLSQSTAAIVGIAGGFLFTWLLSRRGEVIEERRTYIAWLNRVIGPLEELKRRTDVVRLGTVEALQKIHNQQAAGIAHDHLEIPRFELLSHTAYEVPRPTEEDIRFLEQLPSLYEQLRDAIVSDRVDLSRALLLEQPIESRGVQDYRETKIEHDPFQKTGIGPDNFWKSMRLQKEYAIWKWQEISREYDRLASSLKNFRERLVPASIYFLILILFGLVCGGVVTPLAFLSAYPDQSKMILFAISAPLVLAFVAYLAYEVRQLRRAADLSRDTI